MTKRKRADSIPGRFVRRRQLPPSPVKDSFIVQTSTGLGVRAHGQWCGPNYSAGQFQGSVIDPKVAPVDALDTSCMHHDGSYATDGSDLVTADLKFAKETFGTGVKGTLFALGVGLQGFARAAGLKPRFNNLKMYGGVPQHFFPVMKTASRRKYSRVKKYNKRKRVVKRAKKYNKKTRRYRRKYRTYRRKRRGYAVSGATIKYENGSTLSDSQALFVGHGTAAGKVMEVFFMAMVKKLISKFGIEFGNWNELSLRRAASSKEYHFRLGWNFGPAENSVWKETRVNIDHTKDWKSNTFDLQIAFEAAYFGAVLALGGEHYVPMFHRLELWEELTTDANKSLVTSIDLEQMYVTFSNYSSLRIQNRTANGSASGSIDVNNTNPLEGKVYYAKRGYNYLKPRDRPDFAQPDTAGPPVQNYRGLAAGRITGLCTLRSENTSENGGGSARFWKEPPSARDVGAQYAKNFVLHPGQIIVDNWSYKQTWHIKRFAQFVSKLCSDQSIQDLPLGMIRVLGMEKLIADRSEANLVTVGYEVNSSYSISLKHYHINAQPYREVV